MAESWNNNYLAICAGKAIILQWLKASKRNSWSGYKLARKLSCNVNMLATELSCNGCKTARVLRLSERNDKRFRLEGHTEGWDT
jgi:hypothetical protein